MKVQNPATEETIAEVPEDGAREIAAKFAALAEGQKRWARMPLAERRGAIERFGEALLHNRDRLAAILTSEMGKPITQSRNEIGATPDRVRFFTENVERAVGAERVLESEKLTEEIRSEPLVVVANISAWNYPYFVGTNVIVPALLTGNAVLYKPSEHATLSGLEIVRLLHDAGVPADAVTAVVGAGEAGAELVRQPVAGIFFTGSYATGARIARAAAERLLKVQLELGGKDPAYVCEDAPVAGAAASLADGAFYNDGQSCCAVERIYVHGAIYEPFVEALLAAVRAFEVGDPRDEKTYIGPLARRDQLAVLEDQVRDATEKGATLVCGGKRSPRRGWYFEPTVLARVGHEMKVMRDESFGPIIGIQRVSGDDEALRRMNDTEYGLTAAVYTPDRTRAERLLSGVEAATAYWNCCDRVSPRLPWSGRRNSGMGVTLSIEGIRTFVRHKAFTWRG